MTEEANDLNEDQADTQELLSSMNPQLSEGEDGNKTLLIDWHSASKKIGDIKRRNEIVVLENDLLGLRVQMSSRKESLGKISQLAHESMERMMAKTPTRIPLGVG